jgi:hypothetical protein
MYMTLLTLLALAAPVYAVDEDASAQASRSHRSPPFLDAQSIAIARLDLTKIDPGALETFSTQQTSGLKLHDYVADVVSRNMRHLATRLRRLKELKVEQVFVVLTLHDMEAQFNRLEKEPEEFIYAVVPLPEGTDSASVAKALVERGHDSAESTWLALHFHSTAQLHDAKRGNVVLAGPPNLLEYLVKTKHDDRPAVQAALAAAGDGPIQLVVAPSPVFARITQEVLGTVKVDENISLGQSLSQGFRWGAVGLDTQHDLAARVVIQSADADGAKAMLGLIELGKAADEQKQPNAGAIAALAPLARVIDFQIAGDQLRWTIDKDHTSPAAVREALRPVMLAQQIRLGTRQSLNKLRQIALALHNFHDVYKSFPTPATYDKDGKPLLSWRVHVLPYLEENQLYREFRLEEPWDSEHNKKLIQRMPDVYRRPFADRKSTKTPYQAPIGDKTAFRPGKKMMLRDIRDGTSKTIGVVEVDPEHEVIWTKPDDWVVDFDDPTKGLSGGPGTTFAACFLDASVRSLRKSIDKESLRRFLMADDGYPVGRPDTFSE